MPALTFGQVAAVSIAAMAPAKRGVVQGSEFGHHFDRSRLCLLRLGLTPRWWRNGSEP